VSVVGPGVPEIRGALAEARRDITRVETYLKLFEQRVREYERRLAFAGPGDDADILAKADDDDG